jgi:hypothetical protein
MSLVDFRRRLPSMYRVEGSDNYRHGKNNHQAYDYDSQPYPAHCVPPKEKLILKARMLSHTERSPLRPKSLDVAVNKFRTSTKVAMKLVTRAK